MARAEQRRKRVVDIWASSPSQSPEREPAPAKTKRTAKDAEADGERSSAAPTKPKPASKDESSSNRAPTERKSSRGTTSSADSQSRTVEPKVAGDVPPAVTAVDSSADGSNEALAAAAPSPVPVPMPARSPTRDAEAAPSDDRQSDQDNSSDDEKHRKKKKAKRRSSKSRSKKKKSKKSKKSSKKKKSKKRKSGKKKRRRRRSSSDSGSSSSGSGSGSASLSLSDSDLIDSSDEALLEEDDDLEKNALKDHFGTIKAAALRAAAADEEIGPKPVPRAQEDIRTKSLNYGGALRPGEGDAIAQFVQSDKRIPRRGEVGWTGDEIERLEKAGYIMSGSRHTRMNAIRIRKENQVYSAEEKRALALLNLEEQQQRENKMIQQFRTLVKERLEPNAR